jgi:hypothetical protein
MSKVITLRVEFEVHVDDLNGVPSHVQMGTDLNEAIVNSPEIARCLWNIGVYHDAHVTGIKIT